MRSRSLVTAALVMLVVVGAAACSGDDHSTTAARRTITSNAIGAAEGTPDLLTITIGVQTKAANASKALADNNTKAAAVIARLKAGGVAEKDIQTAQLSVNPTYGPTSVITGYEVSNLVTAKLRQLAAAGTVIDDAATVAGNDARVEGISFSIDDDSSLLSQARANAVVQAIARAKTMARAAGVSLGRIRSITDVAVQAPQPFELRDSAAAAAGSSVPIQAGTQKLSVEVAVVYDIA